MSTSKPKLPRAALARVLYRAEVDCTIDWDRTVMSDVEKLQRMLDLARVRKFFGLQPPRAAKRRP